MTPDVRQEIHITPDGGIEFPWVAPPATELVLALWKEHRPDRAFPVRVLHGHIYCG